MTLLAPTLAELLEKQKILDAHDRRIGEGIVKDSNPQTLDQAKTLAANWIATAAQESRNSEYFRGERDDLRKLVEEMQHLFEAELYKENAGLEGGANWSLVREAFEAALKGREAFDKVVKEHYP